MPLQIAPDVFKWLQGLSLVKQAHRNQNNLMQVTQEQSAKLMDGFLIGIMLRTLLKNKTQQQKIKKLDSLKENSTPAIRLYNWSILTDLLKPLGYTLEYADKSKITNYDPQPLAKVINFLFGLKSQDPDLKENEQKSLKVDINQIGKKTLKDTTNALQFLTISISKNFKISPQQTLNLFLDNNKYISHLLAKGVKNSFEPIYALLNQLKSHSEFIVVRLFCLDQEQNVTFLFNALRSCLISKDQQAALLCYQFLLQIYDQYMAAMLNLQVFRKWLKNEGLNTFFFSMKKYPLLMNVILTICYNVLDDQFFKQIQFSQKSILWTTQKQRILFYKNFVEETSPEILLKFSITNYFEEWNRFFIKTMKKSKDNAEIMILMTIMEEQWNKLKLKFEQNDLGLPTIFINFLKTVVAFPNELLYIQACRILFSLMQSLGSIKNPFAPLIYKILITEFSVSNNIYKIVYMCNNFMFSFKGINGLPGSPLVQPLLKHLQNNKQFEIIELTKILMEQKRIKEQQSIDLIQMLTKTAFNDIRFGNIALQAIFVCINSLGDQAMTSYLQTNTKLCLAQLYSLSKSTSKTMKSLKQEFQRISGSQSNTKAQQSFNANATKCILCKNMVGFLAKSIFIDDQIKTQLQPLVFHTYVKIKIELKKVEQADLLRPIMANYFPEEDDLQAKLDYYTNIVFPPKIQLQPRNRGHSHTHLTKSVELKQSTEENEEKDKTVNLDPNLLKPSTYAIKDLQKVKQKRYDLKTLEVEKQKQKVLKEERIQKFKTIQYEKRLVESMTTIKNDVDYKHIQTNEQKMVTIQPQVHQNKDPNIINIRLIDLQKQEEDSYRQDAQSILRKYKKVWRYLFYKYSIKKTESGSEEKAHFGDIWKLLKDYQFNFLKKEECSTLVRLVNQHLKRKNDIQFLNYQGFEDFILQASIFGFGKIGYSHLPPGQQLQLFVQQLKKITKEKSGSIQIFENPQQSYFQQSNVIRQFNKRLKQNPDYILPQGYKRVKQTSLEYQYQFHPMLQKNIKNSYVQVFQVLDWMFSKQPSLGFHLLDPLTIKSERYLAKPFLFQSISQKMKDYTKGYLQSKRTLSASAQKQKQTITLPSPPIKRQFKPYINFSLGIKLGIAQTSLKNKSIAQEVAYCMQDILNAVENQSPIVKRGIKKKITNEFMRRKKFQQVKIDSQRKKDDVNWKKRAESVKLQVEALREKRKQYEKVKKKEEYLQKKKKRQKQQKNYRERIAQFDKVKAKISQKKQALMELKSVQQQKIKKQKQQYRIGVQQYFRKKKQEIKQRQQDYKRKKNDQKQKIQQTENNKKQFVKKLYLSNLKKQEQVLEKVDQIKQVYDDVWKSDQIQQVISENKQSLKLLFDLLLKYEKSKISATNYDEIGLATLNFFCLKFKIIPFMLQKQDVNKIFLYATKEDDDKKSSRKGIPFQKFQQIVFLIATKAKKTLNKLIEKRRKKEKKIQAFLNAQKSAGGNHFQAQDVQQSQNSESEASDDEKPTLQDSYLFNAEDVSEATISEVFAFLKLPKTKADMQERYKQAMETKTSKPKNVAIKQIKESLQE